MPKARSNEGATYLTPTRQETNAGCEPWKKISLEYILYPIPSVRARQCMSGWSLNESAVLQ